MGTRGWAQAVTMMAMVTAGGVAAVTFHTDSLAADGGSGGGGGIGKARDFMLKGKRPADPGGLADYVRDRRAAVALGKALFWDMQTGSDGVQGCASCHFNAGADIRNKNTINPGPNGRFKASTGGGGANRVLTAADFPFHKLLDPNSNASRVLDDSDDIDGSQGVYLRQFLATGTAAEDSCTAEADATFNVGGTNTRRVTGRNAPTALNAAFNFRNFWDGRAREQFNGVNPHGATDPTARIYRTDTAGTAQPVSVLIANGSAASQATGPLLSGTEMSCDGRTFPAVARKLLAVKPLALQHVSSSDSVLGTYVDTTTGKGLVVHYGDLIRSAFQPNLWSGSNMIAIGSESYSQIEANFSLFWGLSIQLYESTLVSDDAPIDRYASGSPSAFTAQQIQGLSLFDGKARCTQCHNGPLLTEATKGSGGHAFANAAVRPAAEDAGDILTGAGRFKTPTLRNVELTGPYFHTGSVATLRQVVDFYNRGGDFPEKQTDSQVRPLGLTDPEKASIVAFLLGLTDERVRYRRAPFDGPEICVPTGALGDTVHIQSDPATGKTLDSYACLPAVGNTGSASPIARFLNVDHFSR